MIKQDLVTIVPNHLRNPEDEWMEGRCPFIQRDCNLVQVFLVDIGRCSCCESFKGSYIGRHADGTYRSYYEHIDGPGSWDYVIEKRAENGEIYSAKETWRELSDNESRLNAMIAALAEVREQTKVLWEEVRRTLFDGGHHSLRSPALRHRPLRGLPAPVRVVATRCDDDDDV